MNAPMPRPRPTLVRRLGLGLALLLAACGREAAPDGTTPTPALGRSFELPDLAMELRFIPGGTFWMGSPPDEPGHAPAEGPLTEVKLSRYFWLGRTPVTHGQWKAIMGTDLAAQTQKALPGNDRAAQQLTGIADDVPMFFVSWDEAMAFCARLTARARAAGVLPKGYEFTLPTEAQWEYACRAKTTDATYAGPLALLSNRRSPVLDAIAWYADNSSAGYEGPGWNLPAWAARRHPGAWAGPRRVGQKEPNAWGLEDMIGNVSEWCRDFAADTLPGITVTDPTGPAAGSDRIVRGGNWHSDATGCRSAARAWNSPEGRSQFIGFRVALVPRAP